MADLTTSIAGMKLRSPIGLSSLAPANPIFPAGPLDFWVDWNKKIIDEGAGFIVLASTGLPIEKFPPGVWNARYRFAKAEPKEDYGYWNAGTVGGADDIETGVRKLKALKKVTPPQVPLIQSILGLGADPNGFAQTAKQCETAGADMIEINAFCPGETAARKPGEEVPPEEQYGMMLGVSPTLVGEVTKAVVKAVKIPVGVKLAPAAGTPGLLRVAEAAIKGGAKYLQVSGSLLGVVPPDIYNDGKPDWPQGQREKNFIVMYGGGGKRSEMLRFSLA